MTNVNRKAAIKVLKVRLDEMVEGEAKRKQQFIDGIRKKLVEDAAEHAKLAKKNLADSKKSDVGLWLGVESWRRPDFTIGPRELKRVIDLLEMCEDETMRLKDLNLERWL